MGEQPKARGVPPGSWLVSYGGFLPPLDIPLADLPPPTRAQRFRRWHRRSVIDAREWVAFKIAPWLDPDDFL